MYNHKGAVLRLHTQLIFMTDFAYEYITHHDKMLVGHFLLFPLILKLVQRHRRIPFQILSSVDITAAGLGSVLLMWFDLLGCGGLGPVPPGTVVCCTDPLPHELLEGLSSFLSCIAPKVHWDVQDCSWLDFI